MLRSLLSPGVWLMAQLPYPMKVALILVLISALWLVPDTAPDIRTVRNELLGVEYSVALRRLLQQLPRYRGMLVAAGEGETGLAEHAAAQTLAVGEAIKGVDQVNQAIGQQLNISDDWLHFKARWQELERLAPSLSKRDTFDQYTEQIEELILLMALVGGKSGLILDSDLESFYLMLLGVYELPWLLNSVQKIRGLAILQQQNAAIPDPARIHIPTLIAAVYEHKNRLIKAHTKVMEGELKTALLKLLPADKDFMEVLSSSQGYSATERFELGDQAVEAIFLLYDQVMQRLSVRLQQRLDLLVRQRNIGAAVIAFCFFLALYLSAGIYVCRLHDSRELLKATQQIRAGDTELHLELINQDELGGVAESFNQLAETLQSERHRSRLRQQRLAMRARVDFLTRLPNRRYLDEQLSSEWKRAQRSDMPLAVVMMDIDYFKQFNDVYGHLQGDECLKRIAAALASLSRRSGDFVARYGGEEFVMVAPDTDREKASRLAIHIQQGIAKLLIPHIASKVSDVVTLSIGVVTVEPGKFQGSWQQLLQRADQALYQAKQQGRNCFVIDAGLNESGPEFWVEDMV